ncbi:MAG: hypothetical protein ACJ79S_03695, partial [Gemmatimonadaceae bacterium]
MSAPAVTPRKKSAAETHAEREASADATSQPQPVPGGGGMPGFNGTRRVPPPVNESVKGYAPGSPERAALKARLKAMASERIDIPLVIGGEEIRTGDTAQSVMPHDHRH